MRVAPSTIGEASRLLIMRRLWIRALDALKLDRFDRLAELALLCLQPFQYDCLLNDNVVQLLELVLQMSQIELQLFQTRACCMVHRRSLISKPRD